MILDAHVHIGTSVFLHMQADADFLVRQADKAGFDRLMVTELNALFYDMSEGNDALARRIAQHPDRLIGHVSIPTPRLGRRAVEEVKRCYEKHGFRGMKIYSHPEASIAEPGTAPLLEAAAECGMVILAHTTPDECDYLMKLVPQARLLMAHMGGHPYAFGDWHRAVAVAKKHGNLLLDTASSQIDNGMIEHAVAELGPEKILFGTDMPLLDPHTQLAKVRGADISDEAKAKILGGNIAELLGLT
ncbi:MAG TPA: amidohydrolase family protein [Phycisphaerae bacterium]|nr:amidohydrolase family protein [Phycisphaerae bacterium]